MAGIFPNSGVAPAGATNAVDADTNCADEFFYSTSGRCPQRLDPSAMNAVMSEILNAVTVFGGQYDCGVLTNLATALQSAGGVQTATAGVDLVDGALAKSTDTGTVWINTSGVTYTPGGTDDASLLAAGFEIFTTGAVTAAVAGTDTAGNAYAAGDTLLTITGGDVIAIRYPNDTLTDLAGNVILQGFAP